MLRGEGCWGGRQGKDPSPALLQGHTVPTMLLSNMPAYPPFHPCLVHHFLMLMWQMVSHLPACLPACLPLPACVPACPCLRACLPVCMHACMHACPCLRACLPACLPACLVCTKHGNRGALATMPAPHTPPAPAPDKPPAPPAAPLLPMHSCRGAGKQPRQCARNDTAQQHRPLLHGIPGPSLRHGSAEVGGGRGRGAGWAEEGAGAHGGRRKGQGHRVGGGRGRGRG